MQKKKYQVFISSTYVDLQEERMAVTQTLLDNDCIPVGMEQFPSSGMSQMEYIEKMLDDCDYYVLILGGRYGSVDSDGIGFTEKEFDYAESRGIPIMSFLIEDIDVLPWKKCETDNDGQEKYKKFREKVSSGRMVKKFKDIGSLQAAVATSINRCKEDFPAVGWVRGIIADNSCRKSTDDRGERNFISNNSKDELLEKIAKLDEEMKKRPPIHIGKDAPTDKNALWIY